MSDDASSITLAPPGHACVNPSALATPLSRPPRGRTVYSAPAAVTSRRSLPSPAGSSLAPGGEEGVQYTEVLCGGTSIRVKMNKAPPGPSARAATSPCGAAAAAQPSRDRRGTSSPPVAQQTVGSWQPLGVPAAPQQQMRPTWYSGAQNESWTRNGMASCVTR